MEVLANAAVAEICKIVDDGYALFRLEIAQSQKENRALKRKLQMMELRFARERAERTMRERLLGFRLNGTKNADVNKRALKGDSNSPGRNTSSGNEVWKSGDPTVREVRMDYSIQPVVLMSESTVSEREQACIKEDVSHTAVRSDDVYEGQAITIEGTLNAVFDEGKTIPEMDIETISTPDGRPEQLGSKPPAEKPLDTMQEGTDALGVIKQEGCTPASTPHLPPDCSVFNPFIVPDEHVAAVKIEEESIQHSAFESVSAEDQMSDLQLIKEESREKDSVVNNVQKQERIREKHKEANICSPSSADCESSGRAQTYACHNMAGPKSLGQLRGVCLRKVSNARDFPNQPSHTHTDSSASQSSSSSALSLIDQVQCQPETSMTSWLPNIQLIDGEFQQSSISDNQFMSVALNNRSSKQDVGRKKSYSCPVCGKAFFCPQQVKTHQRVHTGERPFHCSLCPASFSIRGNLKRHYRVHTGEKPFSCTQCEKRFSHLHQLKMHLRIHSGEKPFSCAHCGKSFSERSYLRLHQRKVHRVGVQL